MALLLGVLALLPRPTSGQDGSRDDVRFHRVHLRNGNFLDGHLVRQDASKVVLRMSAGEMVIRRDQIERIEFVKLRSLGEPARIVPKPSPFAEPAAAGRASEAPAKPAPEPDRAPAKADSFEARLKDASPERRKEMILQAAEGLSDPAAFLADLQARADAEIRPAVSAAILEKKDKAALPAVEKLLRHPAGDVRAEAVRLLGEFGDAGRAGLVRPLLKDAQPGVRAAAAVALERLNDPDAFDALSELCLDADRSVRGQAILSLTTLAEKHGRGEDLLRVLGDAVERARGEARVDLVAALAKSTNKTLTPLFSRLLLAEEPLVRAHAALGLATVEARDLEDQIVERLTLERDYWPRVQLAETAKALKLRKAIPVLIDWLLDSDPNMQQAASRALRGITGQSMGLDHERWSDWWRRSQEQ
jgi:HEAT repeat protein